MLLLRQLLAVIGVAVLLYQQPFVARRSSKVVPLHLALNGALVMASSSPDSLSILNVTSRSLLTPLEYLDALQQAGGGIHEHGGGRDDDDDGPGGGAEVLRGLLHF